MDKIALEGVVLYGRHGVLPEERVMGQRFILDLEMQGDFEDAGKTDRLDKAVNYAEALDLLRAVVEKESFQLLEALALRICGQVLEKFPLVESATIRIRKPHVPLPVSLSSASVEMTRSR